MTRVPLRFFAGSSVLCVLLLGWALSGVPTSSAFLAAKSPSLSFRVSDEISTCSWALAAKKKQKGAKTAAEKKGANHEKWQPYYDALSNYQNQHGHCEVAEDEDPSLRQWLDEQRASYQALQAGRKTKLTRKRAVALEMIGAIPLEML